MGTQSVDHPNSFPDTSNNSAILAWHLGGGVRDPEAQGRLSEATDGMRRFPWERPPSSRGTSPCTCAGIGSRSCRERSPPYIKPSSQLPGLCSLSSHPFSPPNHALLKSSASPPRSHSRHLQPTSYTCKCLPGARLAASAERQTVGGGMASSPLSVPPSLAQGCSLC